MAMEQVYIPLQWIIAYSHHGWIAGPTTCEMGLMSTGITTLHLVGRVQFRLCAKVHRTVARVRYVQGRRCLRAEKRVELKVSLRMNDCG